MRDNQAPFQIEGQTNQNITVAGTSAAIANATGADTRVLRLAATTDCYLAFGAAPTATTSDPVLPAGVVEYVVIHGAIKVAALQVSAGGVLSVTEVTK